MTTVTISISRSLEELKQAYKLFFGKDKKPTKKDIAIWLGDLAEADVADILSHEDAES